MEKELAQSCLIHSLFKSGLKIKSRIKGLRILKKLKYLHSDVSERFVVNGLSF